MLDTLGSHSFYRVMKAQSLSQLYGLVVFLSAAILLILEIVAGRLLAPYIGVSLYTWTSIIGIILAGLSMGHWIGGQLADRGARHLETGIVLILASLSTLGILPMLLMVGAVIQGYGLGLLNASFIFVLTLFFLPASMIGVISPLLTTLALKLAHNPGSVVGRMHALSAVGSILGTFLCGYWLVQWFGTKTIIGSCATILFIMAVPFLKGQAKGGVAILLGLIAALLLALLTWQKDGFASPCDIESSYYCLRVEDERDASGLFLGKSLVIDHMLHSTNSAQDPGLLWVPYAHAIDTLIQTYFTDGSPESFLFGGGGAYTLPRALLHRDPNARITVSEIDPMVTALSREELYLDDTLLQVVHGDVRNLLQQTRPHAFDVVVTDVFHDIGIPWHLTTHEFNRQVKRSLTTDGIYLINVIDVFPQNRLVQSMLRTLQQSFSYVGIWIEAPTDQETRLTFVLSASNHPMSTDRIESISGPQRRWFNIVEFVDQQTHEQNAVLLTDDFAPVERLLQDMLITRTGN